MRRLLAVVVVCSLLMPGVSLTAQQTAAQSASCSNFDAWVWAQSVFESNKSQNAALDPDGDGIACPDLPVSGFAPVLWTKAIPKDAEAAQIVSVTDGDTFKVSIGGRSIPFACTT